MKLPQTETPLIAAALLGAMGLAFAYQGFSAHWPPSLLGAVIFLAGAAFAIRMAIRKHKAKGS
jgi:hypothetical protein